MKNGPAVTCHIFVFCCTSTSANIDTRRKVGVHRFRYSSSLPMIGTRRTVDGKGTARGSSSSSVAVKTQVRVAGKTTKSQAERALLCSKNNNRSDFVLAANCRTDMRPAPSSGTAGQPATVQVKTRLRKSALGVVHQHCSGGHNLQERASPVSWCQHI